MRVLLALLIVLPVLAGCASLPGTGKEVGAPTWSPGHTWSMTWESETKVDAEHDKVDEWSQAEDPVKYTVLRNQSLWGEAGWLVHRDGDWSPVSHGELLFVRSADLLDRPVYNAVSTSCVEQECHVALDPAMEAEGDPEGRFLEFPLADGDSWRYALHEEEYTAEVRGLRSVETQAGTFEAIMVRFTMDAFDVDEEIADMESEGATVHKYDVEMEQTWDVYYAPSVEWIVLEERSFDVTFDVDVEWEDDDRWTDQGRVQRSDREELVSYALETTEPATDQEIMELLDDGIGSVGLPAGHPYAMPIDANVTVDLDAPQAINVADEGDLTRTLTISAHGDSDNYTHQWFVSPPEDRYASYRDETATGPSLDITFDDVGIYGIEVRTFDNRSRYVDRQQIEVDAYFEVVVEGDCGVAVHLVGYGQCDQVEFPMASDWGTRLVVSADVDDAPAGDGRLVILDASGYEVASKSLRDGEATIDREDWGIGGLWTAYVEAPTGTGTEVRYEVFVENTQAPYWY